MLRYEPASAVPTLRFNSGVRLTVGYGFDLARADAPTRLREMGLDFDAVRGGRQRLSPQQIDKLFDDDLVATVTYATATIAGFAELEDPQKWAMIEIIMWLGPSRAHAIFDTGDHAPPPAQSRLPMPSAGFSIPCESADDTHLVRGPAAGVEGPAPEIVSLHGWALSILRAKARAQERYESVTKRPFRELCNETQNALALVCRDYEEQADAFWGSVADVRRDEFLSELVSFARSSPGLADTLEQAIRRGEISRAESDNPDRLATDGRSE